MKALYYSEGRVSFMDRALPQPSFGEALIRTKLAGICATDLEISAGYMDFRGIMGHEFVGIVAKAGNERLIGSRVVGEINVGCGECDYCRCGMQRHCPQRTTLGIMGRDGVFAQYFTLPEENLIVVPEGMDDEVAVFTEPLAAALEIAEQVKIEPGFRILIIGDGRLAALIAAVIRLFGGEITVSGRSEYKLNYFKERGFIITREKPKRDHFDLVIEASGHPSGWGDAVESVKPRGTIVLKSTYAGSFDFNPAPLVIKEISLVGSRCGRFYPALRLLERKLVDVRPLISGIFDFNDMFEALKFSRQKDCFKVLIRFPEVRWSL